MMIGYSREKLGRLANLKQQQQLLFHKRQVLCYRSSCTSSTLGIMRERHNMWERRAPLSPRQIKQLLSEYPSMKVLIQPCSKRVFTDQEYAEAGATVTLDLSEASLIIGVKAPELCDLIPNRAYAFFSHVIKAQPHSMPLLDAVLQKNIRLFDYECITEGGRDDAKRLVTFGYFAGQAGMIDGLQGLGLRLLAEGHSTPLLNIANAYMYATIQEAFEAMDRVARRLEDCTQGMIAHTMDPPIVIAFTGRGNVTQGARSVFERLPHEYVRVCDLPSLKRDVQEGRRRANQLYGVLVRTEDIVRPLQKTCNDNDDDDDDDGDDDDGEAAFDKQHYYRHPHEYEPIFHLSVAPYITMLVNGIYWDKCFPRLISNDQLKAMSSQAAGGSCSLKVVADITCDVDGSVECLTRTSSIESPYYTYDPAAGTTLDGIHKEGVLMLGIDNLPSELPRDASEYFGSALMPIIPQMLQHSVPQLKPESTDLFIANLPPVLQRACIAADGSLTPRWSIIDRLRHKYYSATTTTTATTATVSVGDVFMTSPTTQLRSVSINVELVGHLFDSGVINKVLDMFDAEATDDDDEASSSSSPSSSFSFTILDISVNTNTAQGPVPSRIVLQLSGPNEEGLQRLVDSIAVLMKSHPKADGSIHVTATHQTAAATSCLLFPTKRVLLLGSGRVAKPVVRLFNEAINMNIALTIATDDELQASELVALATGRTTAKYVRYKHPDDYTSSSSLSSSSSSSSSLSSSSSSSGDVLSELVRDCDLVLSLLPATMHIPIAMEAIRQGKHLVTASYASQDMYRLDAEARAKGVILLNEVGLDPGIDHMLVMKAVDSIHSRGGVVTNLVSLCGGLPDPIAANNPFRYKFSWSPRGVLSAATNPAQYLDKGEVVRVPGELLLRHGRASSRFPTLRLEALPNRDSLQYRELYGVPHVHSICRGTLRYEGWSNIMHAMKVLGLFDCTSKTSVHHRHQHGGGVDSEDILETHRTYLQSLIAAKIGGTASRSNVVAFLESLKEEEEDMFEGGQVDEAIEAMSYIGLLDDATKTNDPSHVDGGYSSIAPDPSSSSSSFIDQPSSSSSFIMTTPMDSLCVLLEQRLRYCEGERDMVAMVHEVTGCFPTGTIEKHTSRLLAFGSSLSDGDTAMSETVGYTAAAAAELLLSDQLPAHIAAGVQLPTRKEFYEPILSRLQHFAITWHEAVDTSSSSPQQ